MRIHQMNMWIKRYPYLAGILAILLLLVVYLLTLQRDINGSSHDYLLDTGEIQVALNTWGTIHYTGYPHYTVLSSLLTQLMRLMGMEPAAAASFSSLVWSLGSLWLAYWLMVDLSQGKYGLAGLALLVLGLIETFWLHSVIAEVYSFSFLLTMLLFWLSFRLQKQWQVQAWYALVFVMGLSIFHHRILLLLLFPTALLWGPNGWRYCRQQPRLIFISILLFLSPFLFYIYLPWRAWQDAPWVYGQPETWNGFWLQFTGGEVTENLLRPPTDLQAWLDNGHLLLSHLRAQLPITWLLAGVAGLMLFTYQEKKRGAALLLAAAIFPLFIYVFPRTVWIPAVLMPTLFILVAGVIFLLAWLSEMGRTWRYLGWAILLITAVWSGRRNYSVVEGYVRDPTGRQMIELLRSLPEEGTGVVALPWGQGFFAAAYGQLVTHELSNFILVDHRANFRELVTAHGEIWTPASYLDYWPPSWWTQHLHQDQLHVHMVAPGVVALRSEPIMAQPQTAPIFAFDNQLGLQSVLVNWLDGDTLHLQVNWQALGPVDQDYHVAAHLLAQSPPTGPQDILAQADATHPVSGWFPTSQWAEGEVVADHYLFSILPDTQPVAIWLTFYTIDAGGNFINQPWFTLPISPTELP